MKTSSILGILLLVAAFYVWYAPYYQEQKIVYEKHDFVLKTECVDGKFHPKVQHNLMTYDGMPTNCSQARALTSTPIIINALMAMWQSSIFFTIIHATTWQMQAALFLGITSVAIAGIVAHSRNHTVSAVMKASRPEKPQIRQRVILPAKPGGTPESEIQSLAKKIVSNPLILTD